MVKDHIASSYSGDLGAAGGTGRKPFFLALERGSADSLEGLWVVSTISLKGENRRIPATIIPENPA
jgi:hypothetical protein